MLLLRTLKSLDELAELHGRLEVAGDAQPTGHVRVERTRSLAEEISEDLSCQGQGHVRCNAIRRETFSDLTFALNNITAVFTQYDLVNNATSQLAAKQV